MTLVFLDTETTGLEDHHQVWEIAYAGIGDEPTSFFVPHTRVGASKEAMLMNHYYDRDAFNTDLWDADAEREFFNHLDTNVTIIGANPSFDREMLRRRWGTFPAHHRLLDIESWATAQIDNTLAPMGMSALYKWFADHVGDIPEPDHTAGGDVRTMQYIYRHFTEQ